MLSELQLQHDVTTYYYVVLHLHDTHLTPSLWNLKYQPIKLLHWCQHTVLRDFRVYSPGWTCLKETLFSLVSFYWTKSHYWWHDASTFLLHLDAPQTRLRFSYKLTSVYPNSSFAVHHVFYHYFIRFINSSLSSPAFVQLATLFIYHLSALVYVISLQVYRLCSFSFSSLTLSPICYFGNKNTSTLALQSRI